MLAVGGHRSLGQIHAAIDACYEALAIAPADPEIHLALAELYLDRGWRTLSADKLLLLGRLIELTGDTRRADPAVQPGRRPLRRRAPPDRALRLTVVRVAPGGRASACVPRNVHRHGPERTEGDATLG